MKEQVLTIEQMHNLAKLGVDTSKASMVMIFFNENGEEVYWNVQNNGKSEILYQWYNEDSEIWESANARYFDANTGDYDHSYREECGVFTLQDILNLLPSNVFGDYNFWLMKAKAGYNFSIKNNPDSAKIGTHFYDSPLGAAYDILVYHLKKNAL